MRDLKLLTPELFKRHSEFAKGMAEAGLNYAVTTTLRTYDEQQALWAQGREPLEKVNTLRAKAGMVPIDEDANRRKVTWTLASRHLMQRDGFSHAFDIVIINDLGKASWDVKADMNKDGEKDYYQAGLIGEKCGLIWGGRWANPDFPHFEIKR